MQVDFAVAGHEVLLNGAPWPQARELLVAHGFLFPQGYASMRHLLITLPRAG